MPTRRLSTLLVSAMLVSLPALALAADAPSGFLQQEVVGLELHALSIVQGNGVSPRPGLGIGGMARLGRHRWTQAYFTPVQAGLFVGGTEGDVISARVLTEGGAVLHTGAGALEIGLGAGVGILGIRYGENRCDGACRIGGKGVLLSPVVRFLFREATSVPVGVVLRAEVPLLEPSGSAFGYFTGWGTQVLLGLDVGLGLRPR